MPHPSWNESYASGQLPWDTGQPEPLLVEFVTSGGVAPVRTFEIGAGIREDGQDLAADALFCLLFQDHSQQCRRQFFELDLAEVRQKMRADFTGAFPMNRAQPEFWA